MKPCPGSEISPCIGQHAVGAHRGIDAGAGSRSMPTATCEGREICTRDLLRCALRAWA